MIFVISIVPFLSAVAIEFLYESGFWMAIISYSGKGQTIPSPDASG